MIDEWTNGKVNYFEVESADPGSPTYGYLNPNDGRFYCYGIGPWKYAMEVPCGPNVTSVHSGTIRERRFKILSTYNCLDVMNDMILNSMDADGTIFSKTVVNDDGYFGEVCYKVIRSEHGPVPRPCNATMTAARMNHTQFVKNAVMDGRVVTWVMSPTWGQLHYGADELNAAWATIGYDSKEIVVP